MTKNCETCYQPIKGWFKPNQCPDCIEKEYQKNVEMAIKQREQFQDICWSMINIPRNNRDFFPIIYDSCLMTNIEHIDYVFFARHLYKGINPTDYSFSFDERGNPQLKKEMKWIDLGDVFTKMEELTHE